MKFNHNKKRNTAFLYEVLIVELSRASMSGDFDKKSKLVRLLKEYFVKSSNLKKDLDIYRSFDDVSDLDDDMLKSLIQESKNQFSLLDRERIFNRQTDLIKEINKNFDSFIWTNFVSSYKKLATINQAITHVLPPKKQILIEKKLVNLLSQSMLEKKPFPNVNNLAVKTFIERFNEQYGRNLDPDQKVLLEKYIMSSNDDGMEFKMYFYEEVDRLKNIFTKNINEAPGPASNKLQKIIDKMNSYSARTLDRNLITEVAKIQSLAREINQ